MTAKCIYDLVEDFKPEDVFDADMRKSLERVLIYFARCYFEAMYREDLSDVQDVFDMHYFWMAKEKLYGGKVND